MAEEQGLFDFARVAEGIASKMERRHPHVFGDEVVDSSAMQQVRWEEIKAGALALWESLKGMAGNFVQIGGQMIDGLISGVTAKLTALKDTVVGAATSVGQWFKETLGIASPSRVFMEYGGWVSEGAALGIQKGQGLAAAAAGGLAGVTAAPMAAAGTDALAAAQAMPITAPAPLMALATNVSALWLKLSVAPVPTLMLLAPKAAVALLPSPTFKMPPDRVVVPM